MSCDSFVPPASASSTGVTGSGTTNSLAKWTSPTSLGNSVAFEQPAQNQLAIPTRVAISSNLIDPGSDPVLTVISQGVGLTQHDGGIQSFVTSTYNTTGSQQQSMAGGFFCDSTRSAGANDLINTAIFARAAGGQQNSCFHGLAGTFRTDDGAVILTPGGGTTGFTVGAGATAAAGNIRFNSPFTVDPGVAVSLGQAVAPFRLPGSAVLNPEVIVGATGPANGSQVLTKNMVPALVDAGIEVQLDTTVNAGIRGGFTIYRGAGGGSGGAVAFYMGIGSGSGIPAGVTANDSYLVSAAVGKRLLLSADGTSFTIGAALTGAGDFVATSLRTGNPTAGTGARWRSGNGSPNGAVVGNVGDLWSRLDGGAITTLYVKEAGNGDNLGWTPK